MIKAMGDSVGVIHSKKEKGIKGAETQQHANEEVQRNVEHLEIMLTNPFIQNSGGDLSVFRSAIEDGKAYIAAHPATAE